MFKRADFIVTTVVSWPGWSRDRRFVVFVTKGILCLAAIYPGQE